MTHSFGLDAPSALEAFKNAAEKFKDDELNEDLARDCACKAWHLCDHVYQALGSNSQFSSVRKLQEHVKDTCRELAYLQDICIESKHGKFTHHTPRIDGAKFQDGDFDPADFGHDFDIPRLEVLSEGQPILFNDIVVRAVEFWSKLFDDNGIK